MLSNPLQRLCFVCALRVLCWCVLCVLCVLCVCVFIANSAFVPHIAEGECSGYAVGTSCPLRCAAGYTANTSNVKCTAEGWAPGAGCISNSNPTTTTTTNGNGPDAGGADAGVVRACLRA